MAQRCVTVFKVLIVNSVEALMTRLGTAARFSLYRCPWLFSLQMYSGGVVQFWRGTNFNLEVSAVGYGTDGSTDCGIISRPLRWGVQRNQS